MVHPATILSPLNLACGFTSIVFQSHISALEEPPF